MDSIGTETAFEAAARARALEATGRSVIHLEIGEPDFDTPANVREAAKAALDAGATHYPPFAGIPDLRAAIAEDSAARKGFPIVPSQVFVTVGGKGVMVYAILALVDPGHEVIVPDPGYPIYESLTRFVGGTPVPIPIRMENEFRLDVDELASLITPRTKLLVINSPANPTGGVLTRSDIERVAELAIRHDLLVLADEIYARILYDGAEHVSLASLPGMADRTIVLDGFSKTYAMTGWRLGYAIVPEWLEKAYGTLIINTVSGATAFAQAGAVEALRGPQGEVDAMVTVHVGDHRPQLRAQPAHHRLRQHLEDGRVEAHRPAGGAAARRPRSTIWSRSSGLAATSSSTGSTRSPACAAYGLTERSTFSRISRRRASRGPSWPTGSCRRPASASSPARPSARSGGTTSGSRTRTPARI